MKSFQALKARAADAVKGSVERIQQARRQYYGESPGDPLPLGETDLAPPARPAADAPADPDPVLEHLLRKARSPEVREQFLLIPAENYTAHRQVKVLAATYNVNGRPPPEGVDLSPWLAAGRYADIVAVGFQEIVPLNATNIVLGTTTDAALAWDAQVAATLNSSTAGSAAGGSGAGQVAAAAAEEGQARPGVGLEQQRPPSQASVSSSMAGSALEGVGATPPTKAAAVGGGEQEQQEEQGRPSVDELLGFSPPAGVGEAAGAAAADEAGAAAAAAAASDLDSLSLLDSAPPAPAGDPEGITGAAEPEAATVERQPEARDVGGNGKAASSSGGEAGDQEEPATAPTEDEGAPSSHAAGTASSWDPNEFVQVAAKQMVGVYLSVWARRSLLPHIRGVQVVSVATGALGYFGNKGAVAARMRVYDSGFCFINAHLSSGEAEGDELRRHYDYAEVLRRGYFPPEDSQQAQQAAADAQGISKALHRSSGHWAGALHILDCEHTIWVGDLNYRLQGMQGPEVLAAIQAGELDSLLARDQLKLAQRSRQAFHGWQERPITFPPTFKLRRGTSQYLGEASTNNDTASSSSHPSSADLAGLQDAIKDEQGSMTLAVSQAAFEAGSSSSSKGGASAGAKPGEKEKARTPAWTDRILWRSASPGGMQQLTYAAAEGVTVSDHRPVSGAFFVQAREYVREQVEAALEVARRVADAREMAAVPHCAARPTSLDLGTLEYGEVSEHTISLANTAQAPAHFEFVPVPGTPRALPTWLAAHPIKGCVPVGGTLTITLRACVAGGPGGAAEVVLSELRCSLDSILVLRVEGGNDIFLSLAGRFTPSCFGLSWSTLSTLPRPVGLQQPGQMQPAGSGGVGGVEVGGDTFFDPLHSTNRVPPELVRLTDLLRHSAWLATPGLFVKASDLATAAAARRLGRLSSGGGAEAGGHFLARLSSGGGVHSGEGAGAGPGSGCASPRRQRQQHEAAGLLRFNSARADAGPGSPAAAAAGHGPQEELDSPGSPTLAHRQQALLAVRRALDWGEPFPDSVDAHDAAAALLAFFAELPQPFMPPDVVQVCDVCVPAASTAAPLLIEAASATELAVLCHMLLLMLEVLAPENRCHNGLSPASLAAILAEIWFPALPPAPTLTAGAAQQAQRGAGASPLSVAEISMRRIEFVQLLLEDGAVLQALCAAL